MNNDYLPDREADLQIWVNNFATVAQTNMTALGLTAGDMTALAGYQGGYGTSLNLITTAKASLRSATKGKNGAMKGLTTEVRALVRKIQGNPAVSVALKASLGINTRDTPRVNTPPTDADQPCGDAGRRRNQQPEMEPQRQQKRNRVRGGGDDGRRHEFHVR